MKRSIHIVYFLIYLISFQLQAQGQTLPPTCGGSRVRYGVSGLPNSIFQWDITGGKIDVNYNDSIDVTWFPGTVTGTLTVTEHTSYSCVGAPETSNIAINSPILTLDNQASVCQGNSTILSPSGPFVLYQWSNGDTTKDITVSKQGWYALKATDDKGCSAQDSAYLTVNANPKVNLGNDTTICNTTITLDAGTDGLNYLWSTNERTSRIDVSDNKAQQTFWVRVESDKGCVTSDTINILACKGINKSDIPNTFTPNDDGFNDTWRVKNLEMVPNTSVQIFDRWGRMVYNSGTGLPQGGWDGTSRGRPLPMDSYYYIIKTYDGSSYTGTVTIIR